MLSELAIQRAVCDHLRARPVYGIVWFAVPNGGYRRPTEAKIFKGMGVLPGVPDLILLRAGKMYALELKKANGKLTDNQRDTMDMLTAAGAECAVAYSIDEAVAKLEAWQLLKPNRASVVAS